MRIQHPLQAWSAVNFQQPQPEVTAPLAPIQFDAALAVDPTEAPPAVPFYASVAERLPPQRLPPRACIIWMHFCAFKDPAADYLHKQYAIDFKDVEWLAQSLDEEPLQSLNGLDLWALRQRVYTDYMEQPAAKAFDRARYRAHLSRQGALPAGQLGAQVWQQTLNPLLDFLQQFLGSQAWMQRQIIWQRAHVGVHASSLQAADGVQLVVLNTSLRQSNGWEAKAALELFARHTLFGGETLALCLKSCQAYKLDASLPQWSLLLRLLQAYQGQHRPSVSVTKLGMGIAGTKSPEVDAQEHLIWPTQAVGKQRTGAVGISLQPSDFVLQAILQARQRECRSFHAPCTAVTGTFSEWLEHGTGRGDMPESMSSAQLLDLRQFNLQPGTTLIEDSAGTGKTFTIQYCVLDLIFKGLELKKFWYSYYRVGHQNCARIQQFLSQVYQDLQRAVR